jgi:hypothetical protein
MFFDIVLVPGDLRRPISGWTNPDLAPPRFRRLLGGYSGLMPCASMNFVQLAI